MNFCILGAGAWGTAMALHLDRLGHSVSLVSRRTEHALELATSRENKDYLPNIILPQSLQICSEPIPAIMEAEVILLACPSKAVRTLCESIKPGIAGAWKLKLILSLCKGMEKDTWKMPSDIIREVLPGFAYGALSGPTNAGEVAAGKPTAIVLATDAAESDALAFQEAINGPALRVYRSRDLAGVELGGSIKNIYAIGAGICDGLKLGDNAKAAYLTRCLYELVNIGAVLGGNTQTFYGLSGFGDLVATCNGAWSRNRTFGEQLVKGKGPQELIKNQRTVVEGYWATQAFASLCKMRNLEAPILFELQSVLDNAKSPKDAIISLMSRNLKSES